MKKISKALHFLILLLYSLPSMAELDCPPVDYTTYEQYGPYDYYKASNHKVGVDNRKNQSRITIVTTYHLTDSVINLTKGRTGYNLRGDLDYTLRALPNHPVALDTVSRFEQKRKLFPGYAKKQAAMFYKADCYFQRAINVYGTKQPQTWMLWGMHKHRQGQYEEAINKYQKALKEGNDTPDLYYNMGLTYYKLGKYEEAKKYADKAYKKGYPLPGLKRLLKKLEKK